VTTVDFSSGTSRTISFVASGEGSDACFAANDGVTVVELETRGAPGLEVIPSAGPPRRIALKAFYRRTDPTASPPAFLQTLAPTGQVAIVTLSRSPSADPNSAVPAVVRLATGQQRRLSFRWGGGVQSWSSDSRYFADANQLFTSLIVLDTSNGRVYRVPKAPGTFGLGQGLYTAGFIPSHDVLIITGALRSHVANGLFEFRVRNRSLRKIGEYSGLTASPDGSHIWLLPNVPSPSPPYWQLASSSLG
jgi:hypothetical protein